MNEIDSSKYAEILDEDNMLCDYDSEDNENFVANDEGQEDDVTMLQRDSRGRLVRRR